jgi:hypothetical protein
MPTSESQASITSTARLYWDVSTESEGGVWCDGSSCYAGGQFKSHGFERFHLNFVKWVTT